MISYWGVDHGDEVSKATKREKQTAAGVGAVGGVTGWVTGRNIAAGGRDAKIKTHRAALDSGDDVARAWKKHIDRTGGSPEMKKQAGKDTWKAFRHAPGMAKIRRGGRIGTLVGGTAAAGTALGLAAHKQKARKK